MKPRDRAPVLPGMFEVPSHAITNAERDRACVFCGGNAAEPDHAARCDGRQGRIEDVDLGVRTSDPDTSRDAMAAFDREVMANAAEVVTALHEQFGPMADYELKERFDRAWERPCSAHLYRQARSVARDHGRIQDSGERRVNPTSNRKQIIWEACQTGAAELTRCDKCGHLLRRKEAVEA